MEHHEAPDSSPPAPSGGSKDASVPSLTDGAGLMLGLAATVLGVVGESLMRLRSEPAAAETPEVSDGDPTPAEIVEELGWAAIGAAAAAATRLLSAASAVASAAERGGSAMLRQPLAREPAERLTNAVHPWSVRVQEVQSSGLESASDLGLDLAAEIARRVLDRLDLDEVVDRVNVDRAAARLDVDRLVRRLDLTRLAQGVIDQLDLTSIARRVIDELDLTEIARRVIDELELTELIRESTTTVSVDTVDAIRVGSMTADRALARLVDRLLMRKNGSGPDDDGPSDDPATP